MMKKAPLPLEEEIRQLGFMDDGDWNTKKLITEYSRIQKRLGKDNPHFKNAFLTFESSISGMESTLWKLKDDFEMLWEKTENIRRDLDNICRNKVKQLSPNCDIQMFSDLSSSLGTIEYRLECLLGELSETTNPFYVNDAVKYMRIACLRFMVLANAAQWPKSPGRPLVKMPGDDKAMIDYVREVYLDHPNEKAYTIWFMASENFHNKYPINLYPKTKFLSLEYVQRWIGEQKHPTPTMPLSHTH